MVERRSGLFKGRGAYTEPMVIIQVSIPAQIASNVTSKAHQESFSCATYYRKWIMEGFRKSQSKGEM